MSDDGQTTTTTTSSKLETMSKENLIKLVQSQMILKKKLDGRIAELTTSNSSLCQNIEEIQTQFDREQDLSKTLRDELERIKQNEKKIQQEFNIVNDSLECFRLQNETLKILCQKSVRLENFDQISSDCLNDLLNQIERDDERIRQLIDSTNFNVKTVSSPLTFDDLHEFLKNFVQTQPISIRQINNENQYQIEISRRRISSSFDTFLSRTIDQKLQMILSETTDQTFQFVLNKIDDDRREKVELNRLIDQLRKDLADERERQTTSMSKRDQQLSDLLEMKINEVKILTERVENLQDDLKEYRELVFEKTKQADDLDRQLNVEQKRSEELNEKFTKQIQETNDLKEKQQKMKLLLTRLKKELDEKNVQQPKQSLIDLEIADYEKTIKNLKENLDKKDKEIDELRSEFGEATRQISTFQTDLNRIEEEKREIDERAKKYQNLFEMKRKELQDAKDFENERHQNDENVRQLFDKLRIELDNSKILLSQLAAEKQQLNDRLQQQNETNQRTIQVLEQNLRITQHELEISKKDLESLQDDFHNYKIRAQSVLKQHQSTPREPSVSIMTKNVELEETIEKLRSTIEEANRKIQILFGENEDLKGENDRLTELQTKLTNEWKKRENDLKKKHQSEIQIIENDFQKRLNESHDLLTNLNVQNENLSKSFQEKIGSIRDEYERSISLLQNQLENAKIEIEKLKLFQKIQSENEKDSSQISTLTNEESTWIYAERQQGEGSESTSIDHQSTDIATKTLENVLFGPSSHSRSSSSVGGERPRHVLFEDPDIERQRLEDELNKTKFRLNNTTELLNESELNNVRLSEQVTLLKDEIRRLERNIERTESISNFEYLKNIILKFFILKSSPERLQLIPVLVTMLKLSPEEQEQLTRVAQQSAISSTQMNSSSNGELNQSIVTNNGNVSSSWTSYLNLW